MVALCCLNVYRTDAEFPCWTLTPTASFPIRLGAVFCYARYPSEDEFRINYAVHSPLWGCYFVAQDKVLLNNGLRLTSGSTAVWSIGIKADSASRFGWSRGMIPAVDAVGHGFDPRVGPIALFQGSMLSLFRGLKRHTRN